MTTPKGAEPGSVPDSAWAPAAPHRAPTPDELLPGYRDAVIVARGGDSVVYRAHQVAVDRDVAIKVVQLDDPESVARFERELAITVRLGREHPHIMTVLATGTTAAGQPCLVMDFVELGSLHDRLVERGPLPVSEVVAAGSVVADALAFAHAKGVLHRDVKPQNVLVLPTSYVLADFGLARAADAGHSASLERFSYRHASPQVLDGLPPSAADDVYSLGSTLFTLLDGRAPFAADDPDEDSALGYLRRARTESPRPLVRDDLPAGLADVVARCLAKDPAARFGSAQDVRDALDAIFTETRTWAPEPAEEPTVLAEPLAEPPAEPPAGLEPDPVAVSALAHFATAAPPPAAAPSTDDDDEATGRRPGQHAPVAPVAPPRRRRWIWVAAAVVAIFAASVAVGILRSGGRHPVAAARTTTRTSSAPPVVDITALPGRPTASVALTPSLAPTITRLRRSGASGVEVRWTDPSKGRSPFVVVLADAGATQTVLTTLTPGTTTVTLERFPTGRHCLSVWTVAAGSTGNTLIGKARARCVSG